LGRSTSEKSCVTPEGGTEPGRSVPERKVKSPAGRKQGYRMQAWQKELQLTSIRNRDLENFNSFLRDFAEVLQGFRGKEFFILSDTPQRNHLVPQERVFVLRDVLKRDGGLSCNTLFLYQNVSLEWERVCLKVFDNYTLVREKKLFPHGEEARTEMYRLIGCLARTHEQDFPLY
jgi:hypothetical protein